MTRPVLRLLAITASVSLAIVLTLEGAAYGLRTAGEIMKAEAEARGMKPVPGGIGWYDPNEGKEPAGAGPPRGKARVLQGSGKGATITYADEPRWVRLGRRVETTHTPLGKPERIDLTRTHAACVPGPKFDPQGVQKQFREDKRVVSAAYAACSANDGRGFGRWVRCRDNAAEVYCTEPGMRSHLDKQPASRAGTPMQADWEWSPVKILISDGPFGSWHTHTVEGDAYWVRLGRRIPTKAYGDVLPGNVHARCTEGPRFAPKAARKMFDESPELQEAARTVCGMYEGFEVFTGEMRCRKDAAEINCHPDWEAQGVNMKGVTIGTASKPARPQPDPPAAVSAPPPQETTAPAMREQSAAPAARSQRAGSEPEPRPAKRALPESAGPKRLEEMPPQVQAFCRQFPDDKDCQKLRRR